MKLRIEIERFREWAAERLSPTHDARHDHYGAEWECDYPNWTAIYEAVTEVLRSSTPLSEEDTELLVYALARDNEDERVLDLLASHPGATFAICTTKMPVEQEARWQLAVALGRIASPEARNRLRDFLSDDDEYVRRRARAALDAAPK